LAHLTLPKMLWFVAALALAWSMNAWRHDASLEGLAAAREGDRGAAERWVDRALREKGYELHEARAYLSASTTRQYVRRPDYVETFVEKLYDDGAPKIEVGDHDVGGYRFARYLLITLPDDPSAQESIIADAQSFVRRDAVVYRGVTSADLEEIVRNSTLVGKRRVLVELPKEED